MFAVPTHSLLDRLIPLRNASHAHVLRYSVEIPMRYCECSATLADGKTTALLSPRAFVGWSCRGRERSYLFRSQDRFIQLSATTAEPTDAGLPVRAGGISVRQLSGVKVIPMPQGCKSRRTFVGIDGSLFALESDKAAIADTLNEQIRDDAGGQRFPATAAMRGEAVIRRLKSRETKAQEG